MFAFMASTLQGGALVSPRLPRSGVPVPGGGAGSTWLHVSHFRPSRTVWVARSMGGCVDQTCCHLSPPCLESQSPEAAGRGVGQQSSSLRGGVRCVASPDCPFNPSSLLPIQLPCQGTVPMVLPSPAPGFGLLHPGERTCSWNLSPSPSSAPSLLLYFCYYPSDQSTSMPTQCSEFSPALQVEYLGWLLQCPHLAPAGRSNLLRLTTMSAAGL